VTGAQTPEDIYMSNPDNPIHKLVNSLSESALISILEAARVALADEDIAAEIGEKMDISGGELAAMQDKIHDLLYGEV
jgi:hypothetical protein